MAKIPTFPTQYEYTFDKIAGHLEKNLGFPQWAKNIRNLLTAYEERGILLKRIAATLPSKGNDSDDLAVSVRRAISPRPTPVYNDDCECDQLRRLVQSQQETINILMGR